MDIGTRIKQLREECGLSQDALADKLHVTRQAVSKWENGRGDPDIENIIYLSEEFGISIDELVKSSKTAEEKIIADSAAKKWHLLVIVFLISVLANIATFAFVHKIYMVGFCISTLFMLGIELRIYFRQRVNRKRKHPAK
jgi:transcriptional regulator with XRE-family HTH domain